MSLLFTEIPNYDASLYTSERLFAVAKDGCRIPISLVYRRDRKLDSNNYCLLYGICAFLIVLIAFLVYVLISSIFFPLSCRLWCIRSNRRARMRGQPSAAAGPRCGVR